MATTASFNALRQDFVDLRTRVDNGFTEIRGKFDVIVAGQQQIVDLLQTVITDRGTTDRRHDIGDVMAGMLPRRSGARATARPT